MKKIIILAAAFLLVASSAFAAGSSGNLDFSTSGTGMTLRATTGTIANTSPLIGKCSTGVAIAWYLDSTGGGYALMTQHKSGTKAYGTSYDSTAIYISVTDVTPGNFAYNSGALSATDTTDFTSTSNWKKM